MTTPALKTINKWPDVATLSIGDVREALAAGVRDFRSAPQYGLAVGGMYALAGWLIAILLFVLDLPYLVYPIAMGFALIAPFASVGFYSVSDLIERGQPLSWSAVLDAIRHSASRDLRWMALITGFTFFMWVDYAAIIFLSIMGYDALGPHMLNEILTTSDGWLFLVVGNLSGAIIAFIVFSISVVTYPMLYDRDVDFVTAMATSVRLVMANPVTMLAWCAAIGIITGIGLATAFIGLAVTLPILGHASWHLYRRAVGPDPRTTTPD